MDTEIELVSGEEIELISDGDGLAVVGNRRLRSASWLRRDWRNSIHTASQLPPVSELQQRRPVQRSLKAPDAG